MKWFEQKTDEYSSLVGIQILKGFGASGYGAYSILKQIISANMNEDVEEWGFVPETETMESLAQICCLPIDQFRLFMEFCDERFIFEKKNGRLFCQAVLNEKNNYADRLIKRNKDKQSKESELSGQSGQSKQSEEFRQNDVTTQHNTTQTDKQEYIPAPKVAGPPKIPTELQEVVTYLETKTKVKIPNWGKQASAWKMMQKSGYSLVAMKTAIDWMADESYWQENGFDLTNVMNNIAKIKQKLGGSG